MAKFNGRMQITIGANTTAAEKALKGLSKEISKFSKQLDKVGKGFSTALTVPLTAWGTAATVAAGKVKNALKEIASVSGATGNTLRELQADFRTIAAQVPNDMNETGRAIGSIHAVLGATGSDLRTFTQSMLNMSRITQNDLAPTLKGVTQVMNSWHIDVSQGSQFLDKLVYTSQKTGASINDLTNWLSSAANTFQIYNFSIDEALAMMGSFEKAGVETERVLTGLDRSLGNLAEANIKDLAGGFRDFLEAIKEAPNDTEALRITSSIFGKISDVPLMNAIRSGGFDFDKFASQIAGATGTVNKLNAETESFSVLLDRVKNRLTLALEPLGTHILKIAEEYMPALTNATEALNVNFSDTTIKIGMIAAAIGPVVLALGAMTAAASSLIGALSALIGLLNGPIGLILLLGSATAIFSNFCLSEYDARNETQKLRETLAGFNDELNAISTENLQNQLVALQSMLIETRKQTVKLAAELQSINNQKSTQRLGIFGGGMGSAVKSSELADSKALENELAAKIKQIDSELTKRTANSIKNSAIGITPRPTGASGAVEALYKNKVSGSGSSGKSALDIFVENVQDRIKYLNEDGLSFIETINVMQAKLKPLSADWKKLEDLRLNIETETFNKSIQDIQDRIKYLDQDGADFLITLQAMAQNFDPLSEKGKRVADITKSITDNIYREKWSAYAWDFAEGLLNASDYATLLKDELSNLTEGTDKWREKFSTLQNVEFSEVSRTINNLSEQLRSGEIQNTEYETVLQSIISEFAEFPRVVQLATDALDAFHRQSAQTSLTTGQQLTNALQNTTKNFKELQGQGILGVVDGFLQASISGENFGESLKKLGQDIIYTTLKMLILSQLSKWLGGIFSAPFGGTGSLFGFAHGGILKNGITPYARGGIVNRPTVFPMADGMGLMGEAGAEAVMPLKRDSTGRLGVSAEGVKNSAPTVIVNLENQSGNQLTAQQGGVSFDERFNRAVVQVILRDQATNGPISRNYKGSISR